MSERNLQGWRAALIGALVLAAPADRAIASEGCVPLSANFVLCAAGTDWDGAERIEDGTGAALAREPYWLEFTEDWADRQDGQDIHAASAAEAAHWAEVVAGMGDRVAYVPLAEDRAETTHLRLARRYFTVQVQDNPPLGMAVIYAEGGGAQIRLQLTIEGELDADVLEGAAQDLTRLIRPAARD